MRCSRVSLPHEGGGGNSGLITGRPVTGAPVNDFCVWVNTPRDSKGCTTGSRATVEVPGGHGQLPDTIRDEVKPEIVYYRVFIRTDSDVLTNKAGDHANEMETALMMHLTPQWVAPLETAHDGSTTPSNPASRKLVVSDRCTGASDSDNDLTRCSAAGLFSSVKPSGRVAATNSLSPSVSDHTLSASLEPPLVQRDPTGAAGTVDASTRSPELTTACVPSFASGAGISRSSRSPSSSAPIG